MQVEDALGDVGGLGDVEDGHEADRLALEGLEAGSEERLADGHGLASAAPERLQRIFLDLRIVAGL